MQTHPIPCKCGTGWTVTKSDDPRLPDEKIQCADCKGAAVIQVLDCGHPPTPGMFPGATDNKTGATACMECATKRDVSDFLSLGRKERWFGYLSPDKNNPRMTVVSSFGGGVLVSVHYMATKKHRGFGGRTHERTYWRGKDSLGRYWYGVGPGMNMYTRMKQRKVGHHDTRKG